MDLDKAIQSRKSVKKFKTKIPNWKDILECIDAARYAPMAGNNYTVRFILVNDKESIQRLADCCQQDFVGQAHFIVAVCSDESLTENAFGKEMAEKYCRQQAGAAIQNFLLKLEEKKLSTCWVGLFEEEMVKRELKIPANIVVEALFPIGYEYDKQKSKKKIEIDSILFFNKYKNKQMGKEESLDV